MQLLGITKFLAQFIIRPPRAVYNIQELGKPTFCYQHRIYQRTDMKISIPKIMHPNYQQSQDNGNMKTRGVRQPNYKQRHIDNKYQDKYGEIMIQASLYQDKYAVEPRDTIIYLHPNSASRVSVSDSKNYLQVLISNYDIVAFDFRACGNTTNSQYVTLGYLEKYDVEAVMKYIDKHFGKRRYILWGRSMGAVTAILHAHKFKSAKALVLDSPFSDMNKVIGELADKNLPIAPEFVVSNVITNIQEYIEKKIRQEYGKTFKISNFRPLEAVKSLCIPTFFIGGEDDDLVDIQHVQTLYECAKGMKNLAIVPGGHNEIRSNSLKRQVVAFLKEALLMDIDPIYRRKKIFQYQSKDNKDLKQIKQKKQTKQIKQWKQESRQGKQSKEKRWTFKEVRTLEVSKYQQVENLTQSLNFNVLQKPITKRKIFSRQDI